MTTKIVPVSARASNVAALPTRHELAKAHLRKAKLLSDVELALDVARALAGPDDGPTPPAPASPQERSIHKLCDAVEMLVAIVKERCR